MHCITLANAPLATPLTLTDGPPQYLAQLGRLGLRPGAVFTVLRRCTGGGRIVSVAGARVALGRAVLQHVVAEAA